MARSSALSGKAPCAGSGQGTGPLIGEGYANAYFTEARIRQLLGEDQGFSVLHVGTHFALRPGNISRPLLLWTTVHGCL